MTDALPTRGPRADASRNREHLLAVATEVFASGAAASSMRAIAREAGVGIGTVYRHFPTREALVDAVYRDQVTRLTSGARRLLDRYPPAEALRRWADLFGTWIATKNGMLDTLLAVIESDEIAHADTRTALLAAVTTILDAGQQAGDLRTDVAADDVTAALIGVFTVAPVPSRAALAHRLLDILVDGLRPPAGTRTRTTSGRGD